MKKIILGAAAAAAVIGIIIFAVPAMRSDAASIAAEEHMNDESLTNISIPSGTTSIGTRSYYGCKNLCSVIIPDGVTTIGESAFAMCPELAYVQIPPSVKKIGSGAFAGDSALSYLAFNGSNNHFFYSDGVLYSPSSNEIISYLPGNKNTEYDMPDSVTKIDKYAFWGADYLLKVTVSDKLNTIAPYAFSYSHNLNYIFLPASVKSLQEYSFRDCRQLQAVYAENKNIKIDETAFYNGNSKVNTVSGASLIAFNQEAVIPDTGTDSQGNEEIDAGGDTASSSASGNDGATEKVDINSTQKTQSANTTQQSKEDALTKKLSGPYRQNTTPNLLGSSYIVGGRAVVIMSDEPKNSVSGQSSR